MNIPEQLEQELEVVKDAGKSILLFGVGGGFDLLACLPLYYELRMKGYSLELANYSLVDFALFPDLGDPLVMSQDVYGMNWTVKAPTDHFPEGYLSMWFKQMFQEEVIVWMLRRGTTIDTVKNLHVLMERQNVGAVIFCGAGARAIMLGNEEGCGEMLHTSIVLAAVKQMEQPSYVFTIGINTHGGRRSESMYSAMENHQLFIREEGYFGGASLTKYMDSFKYYKSAYEFVIGQPGHKSWPMHEMIITAAFGGFGMHKDGGFVCPLMAQGNFYDALVVANANLLIPHIESMNDYDLIVQQGMDIIHNNNSRVRVAME